MSEITHTFDHLSTQLAIVGLKVKVLKYKLWSPSMILPGKLWSPSMIFPGIEIPQGYILVINDLYILGVLVNYQDFAMFFKNEVLFLNMVHIDDFPFLGNAQVVFSILSSCIIH